ncbi:hypothetical protein [Bacillus testis]|uniref:hypothetical protein n=1 Tax=Bacillus testis TaxID=1622072 RepID=UPI00067E719C|nr:hypothetical protein [Bacillus testis]
MSNIEKEKQIIAAYQQEESKMVLLFAQWCINNDVNPMELYSKAYPGQGQNKLLTDILPLTVPKEEAYHISSQLLLDVLASYGNDDLAFVIQEYLMKKK